MTLKKIAARLLELPVTKLQGREVITTGIGWGKLYVYTSAPLPEIEVQLRDIPKEICGFEVEQKFMGIIFPAGH
jgi:hypothetical protein